MEKNVVSLKPRILSLKQLFLYCNVCLGEKYNNTVLTEQMVQKSFQRLLNFYGTETVKTEGPGGVNDQDQRI